MPLRFAHRIFRFANSNIENLLGELGGIVGTFGHETSIARAARTIYAMKIRTDAITVESHPSPNTGERWGSL